LTGTLTTARTGFDWLPSLARSAVLLGAAVAVLVLQYRWRRTAMARVLSATAIIVGQCLVFMPWSTVIALSRPFDTRRPAGQALTIRFDRDAGRLRSVPGQSLDDIAEKPGIDLENVAAENQRRRAEGARSVFLPIRAGGVPVGARLLADRSAFRVRERNGRLIYQGTGNDFELHAGERDATVHQGLRLPANTYARWSNELVDIELEYWFTLFQPSASYAIPAKAGTARLPGIGWCATKVDETGTRVLFQCLQPGERPSCLSLVLEHAPTGHRNEEVSLCAPDYSPLPGHAVPDAISRFGGRLPFYDPSGGIRYPVSGAELAESRVVVTNFVPMWHVTRRLELPGVRLVDWTADTSGL
jgi:hypothetical protein